MYSYYLLHHAHTPGLCVELQRYSIILNKKTAR